jgi:hypothetical protein
MVETNGVVLPARFSLASQGGPTSLRSARTARLIVTKTNSVIGRGNSRSMAYQVNEIHRLLVAGGISKRMLLTRIARVHRKDRSVLLLRYSSQQRRLNARPELHRHYDPTYSSEPNAKTRRRTEMTTEMILLAMNIILVSITPRLGVGVIDECSRIHPLSDLYKPYLLPLGYLFSESQA